MDQDTVGRPMEILLVEDSLADARLVIEALREGDFKHRLTCVRDGEEAMLFLRQEERFAQAPRPDLVLLDLNLPRKDGREVLDEIRLDANLHDMPVVIMTSSDMHEDMVRAEQLSVDAYVTKPVNLDKFVSIIRELKRFWREGVILPVEV